jgi:transmembrane sensor
MDHPDTRMLSLLDAYLAGTSTAEEQPAIEAYLSAHPWARRRLDVLRRRIGDGDVAATSYESVRAHLLSRIARDVGVAPQFKGARLGLHERFVPRTRTLRRTLATRVLPAAGLVAGVVAMFLAYRAPKITSFHPGQVYTTYSGQRATVHLADGSSVILAPQTILTVAESFGRTTRAVTLTGEARFDVAGSHVAPFTVTTGAVVTRVLGTQFNVQRYPDDTVASIAVMSGKVAVDGPGHSTTLTAGMMGRFTDSTTVMAGAADATAAASWVDGRLVFTDVPVPAMLTALSRWCGCQFQLDDSTLATRHATAIFNVNDQAETMRLLKGLLNVTMTFRGSTVILQPAPATRTKRIPHTQNTQSDRETMSSGTEVGR